MIHLGNIPASSTIYIPFATYDSNGASVTLTGLAVTDIEIYKNGSVTQRASDAGYALLDTDGIDFDGITGIHGFSIDLSDNTDAGFFAAGSTYWVVVSAVTVSTQTVNFVAATFRIVAAENTSGTPVTDAVRISGDATAADNAEAFFDGTGYAGTNNVIPLVTTTTTATNVTTVNGLAAGVITAASIAADAITDAKVASDVTIASVTGAVGSVTGLTASDVAAIKAKTDSLTFTVANEVNANARYISGSSESADRLERSTLAIVTGTCDTGGATTTVIASALSPTSAVNDQFNGRIITFDKDTTTAALRGQATDITDYVHATLTFTVTALTTAPASGDTFVIT